MALPIPDAIYILKVIMNNRWFRLAAVMGYVSTIALVLSGCSETTSPPTGVQPTYSSIQANVFSKTCATADCHSATGHTGSMVLEAGVAYDNIVGVVPNNGTAKTEGFLRVYPGKPDSSFIMIKLNGPRSSDEGARMPKGGTPLSAETIEAIRTWIANGAKRD